MLLLLPPLLLRLGRMGDGSVRLLAAATIFAAAVIGVGLPWHMRSYPRLMALGNAVRLATALRIVANGAMLTIQCGPQ